MSTQIADLTPEQIAHKALELAEASPEFTYTPPLIVADDISIFTAEDGSLVDDAGYEITPEDGDCQYTTKDESGQLVGSCLFGQALGALGVDLTDLQQHEGNAIATVVDPEFGSTYKPHTNPVIEAMRQAQNAQDGGVPWGEAAKPLRKALGEAK